MSLLSKVIGPKSKYENDIPYTYEARQHIVGEKYNSFLADTICALVAHLEDKNIKPDEIELYEIFKEKEKKLNIKYCISEQGEWLSRKELCISFTKHYPGHIDEAGCTFEDREKGTMGP